MKTNSLEYFAAVGREEVASRLFDKVTEYSDFLRTSGRLDRIIKSYAIGTGGNVDGTGRVTWGVTRGGQQGELLLSAENHYRNICNNLVSLITAQRPAVQVEAANTDYKSITQTLVAAGLIDQYLTERKVEVRFKRAVKSAVYTGEGFISVEWDALSGEDYMPQPDALMASLDGEQVDVPKIKAGDIKFNNLGPLDVIRDIYAPSWDAIEWVILRSFENKFELAARYPDLADDILAMSNWKNTEVISSLDVRESDSIPVYTFIHKKNTVLPDGRIVQFVGDKVVLYDGPSPYSDLPVYRVTPDELDGTPFGDTHLWDLLGPQDTINAIASTIITNELGRGIGNILVPRSANISVEALSSSMNEISYDGTQPPSPLAWPSTPPEFFSYKREVVSSMEVLSSINSVLRGNPSEAVGADASGAKLALIQAQASQSNNSLEKSYTDLVRDVCLAILHRFRDFGGNVPRLARLVGKNNAYMVKDFTADDLQGIDRVKVDVGSPLTRTVSGKMAIADKLVEMGVIKTAEQYLLLVKAGTYEPLVEGEQTQQLRIRGENERLMEGQEVRALVSDPHWTEITQHLSILDNPALRESGNPKNDAIQMAVLQHVQEHIELFRTADPAIIMLRGGPNAMQMWQQIQAPMVQQPAQGQPQPAPEGGAEQVMNPEASAQEAPGMPSMPKNPMTGETVQMPGSA